MSSRSPADTAHEELAALRRRVAELEEQLASSAKYATFFERSPAMLCIGGTDGHFLELSGAWESALGWSRDELRARPFLDFVHPDDRESTVQAATALAAGTSAVAFENRYLCKDGSYRWLRWFATAKDERGLQYGVAHDITPQRLAEERARVFEDVILNSATGIVVLRLEQPGNPKSLRILMANDAANRFSGADLKGQAGRLLSEAFPKFEAAGLHKVYASVAESGGSRDIGEVTSTEELVKGTFALRAYGLPDHRVCVNFENVTERKRAEEALRQSIRQEEIIRAQALALAELSTPLIPVSEDVVVMPLIGTVDSTRAQQVMDTLLSGIVGRGAKVAILDITGVAVVDTQVANAIVRAARAARMLGAEVMLTGIRPEVARTLVGLDIDLEGIMTHGSLQAGIAAAFRRRGR